MFCVACVQTLITKCVSRNITLFIFLQNSMVGIKIFRGSFFNCHSFKHLPTSSFSFSQVYTNIQIGTSLKVSKTVMQFNLLRCIKTGNDCFN